jgi:hypothetical protein
MTLFSKCFWFGHVWKYRICVDGPQPQSDSFMQGIGRVIRECKCGKKQIEMFVYFKNAHHWFDLIDP